MQELQPTGEEYIPFGTTYFEFHADDPETAQSVYDEIRAKVKGTWGNETAIFPDKARGIVTVTRIREKEENFHPFDRSLNHNYSNWALKQLIKDLRARFLKPVSRFFKSEDVDEYYKFPNRTEADTWKAEKKAAEIAAIRSLEFLLSTLGKKDPTR